MVRARITTAAATTAKEIQKMGARRTRCMMVVLVLRVGNPGGSPLHPSIRAPSEIGSRSGLPVCMGRHADHRNRGAPPRLPAGLKATCRSIESVGSRRPCGAIVGAGAGTDCGTGRGGCAVLAAPSGGAEISVRELPGGETAEGDRRHGSRTGRRCGCLQLSG